MRYQDLKALLYRRFRPEGLTFREAAYRGARFVVLANEDVGWRLLVRGEYEEAELQALSGFISKGSTCIDVGANIGIYTVLLAKLATEGRIYAFEPVPLNSNILALNIEINGLTNVEVQRTVLSDTPGPLDFSVSSDGAYSSIQPTRLRPEARTLATQAATLDELFFETARKVDLIKIDVEGAELKVLRGGKRLLGDESLRPHVLLVELNERTQSQYGYAPLDVLDCLQGFGYAAHSITARGIETGWPRQGSSENALFLQKPRR